MSSIDRLRGRKLQEIRRRKQRENPLCEECLAMGQIVPWTELDHIVPLEKGGTNDYANLQGLCVAHHQEKTAQDRGYTRKKSDKWGCSTDGIPNDPTHPWHSTG